MWQGGLSNMKLILTSFILGFALAMALPNQELPAPRPNCIRMTPEKDRQIDVIVEKIGNFLNNLSIEHEHFDIRLIKLSIEQHSEDEVEEKETVLQLLVNDCQLPGDELEEIDHYREMAKQAEKEREAKLKQNHEAENAKVGDAQKQKSENLKNKQKHQNSGKTKEEILTSNEHTSAHELKEAKTSKKVQERQEKTEGISKTEHEIQNTDVKPETQKLNSNDEEAKSGKNFEVLYLDLDDNGQELVKAIGRKKKPQVVYVQERNSGQTEFWFLKRR